MTGGLSSVSSGCRAVALPGLSALLALESCVSPEHQCFLPQPTQDLEREDFAGSRMASQHREGLHCLPTFDSKPAQSSHHHEWETAREMQHLFLHEKKFHDLSRRKSKDLIIRQIQAELHAWKGAGSPPPTAHLPPSLPSKGALTTTLAGWAGQTRCWHTAWRGLLTWAGAHSGRGHCAHKDWDWVRLRARAFAP